MQENNNMACDEMNWMKKKRFLKYIPFIHFDFEPSDYIACSKIKFVRLLQHYFCSKRSMTKTIRKKALRNPIINTLV